MSFERPDSASDIDWENAPRGTTHAFIGSNRNYWMKLQGGTWFYFWYSDWSEDATDPGTNRERCVPRPSHSSSLYDPRDEATHVRIADGRMIKPGSEGGYAMIWGQDSLAWLRTRIPAQELNNPYYYTPIQRTAPSTEIVFTMTEEQSKAIALDKRPMKVVMVQFQDTPNAKEYAYWAPEGTKSGDFAVVHQSGSIAAAPTGFPFVVVKVTQDEVLDTSRATKAILGTFDESFALHVQARIEHMTRVKAKLAQKKKAFEESAFYEMLAKSDPEAAALLDELKQFNL